MITTEGEIFEIIQKSKIFLDSKTFVDAIPNNNNDVIKKYFQDVNPNSKKELMQFVQNNFFVDMSEKISYSHATFKSIKEYIDRTWDILTRNDGNQIGSKISLPNPYIVPGGRFRELYYWDSYFTSVGLAEENRYGDIENFIKNFIFLQKHIGLIPNGSRSYYSSRSQPPVLVLLIDLLYKRYGIEYIESYIPSLEIEYTFWMTERVINIQGHKLNRYFDPLRKPRPESYIEDKELASNIEEKDKGYFFQAIRSAAESGWDFSSRWMRNENMISSSHTQDFLPIDLNALLYLLEYKLYSYKKELGENKSADKYKSLYEKRTKSYHDIFWDDSLKCYYDFNFKKMRLSNKITAAISWALFVGLASEVQALYLKTHIENHLLKNGGIVTTDVESGEQWDSPNGWAPIQWVTVIGLRKYGFKSLAKTIMIRWCYMVEKYYEDHGVILEKYDVCNIRNRPEKGEYKVQEGFSWTNGVYLAFKNF